MARKCSRCGQPGHRADGCPNTPEAAVDVKAAAKAKDLVAVLVRAAQDLGQTQALAAVEEATGEVLRQAKELRLALLRSRSANRRLRAQVEDQAVAKDLKRLDDAEGGK